MALSRGKGSVANILLSLGSQVIVVVVGLFLPRALIVNYGSEVNGIVTSLQQIVAYLTLVEGGIAGSTMAALYKPLANGDTHQVSVVCSAARRFYNKAGWLFVGLVFLVGLGYPVASSKSSFGSVELFLFVALSGVNGATQLLFIGKYKALLMASRNNGIVMAINASSTALYSLIFIVLSYCRVGVLLAFMMATCAYFARALAFYCAAKRKFPKVNYRLKERYAFAQQRDVLAQQILNMVILNSPTVIMTLLQVPFSVMSVYSVYNLVLSSVFMLFYTIENTMTATFGNIVATETKEELRAKYFDFVRLYSVFWSWAFVCLAALFIPFIEVYSQGVVDAEYVLPFECALFIGIAACWTLRNAETVLFTAAGRFREHRRGFAIEACICVVLSVAGCAAFGLAGLLLGRLVSSAYRVVDLARRNARDYLDCSVLGMVRLYAPALLVFALGSVCCFAVFDVVNLSTSVASFLIQVLIAVFVATACALVYSAAIGQLSRIRSLLRLR